MAIVSGPIQIDELRKQLTCPHCWQLFATDQLLWISESPDLLGDSRLGSVAQQRFLPYRFDANAHAIDAHGFSCHRLACPNCHLPIPRPFLQMPPFFISIVGAPAAGKSYYLASMTWRLRKVMPKYFQFTYADADPAMNLRLQQYESQQFLQTELNTLVAIEKTEVYGDIYNTVLLKGQNVAFPQPFTFSMTPGVDHPMLDKAAGISRILCLYDNAGESYLPGEDSAIRPVTRHLTSSNAIFFLFDPTQDSRFRKICQDHTDDPQMKINTTDQIRRSPVRQESILAELVSRIRNHRGTQPPRQKTPLVIVLTKTDAWSYLLGPMKFSHPWVKIPNHKIPNYPACALDTATIEETSAHARQMMVRLIPEIVSAAEQLTDDITYIPVSATGGPPSVDPTTGALGFRSGNIRPFWVEVPLLYILSKQTRGIVPAIVKR